jgi:hypothetical protein
MTLADPRSTNPPLAAGLFGGASSTARQEEPLVSPAAKPSGEGAAARRQSFSDLFRADGGHLHSA